MSPSQALYFQYVSRELQRPPLMRLVTSVEKNEQCVRVFLLPFPDRLSRELRDSKRGAKRVQ